MDKMFSDELTLGEVSNDAWWCWELMMIISDLVYKKRLLCCIILRIFFLFLKGMHFTKGKISAQVLWQDLCSDQRSHRRRAFWVSLNPLETLCLGQLRKGKLGCIICVEVKHSWTDMKTVWSLESNIYMFNSIFFHKAWIAIQVLMICSMKN